jgi:hypothetical protein
MGLKVIRRGRERETDRRERWTDGRTEWWPQKTHSPFYSNYSKKRFTRNFNKSLLTMQRFTAISHLNIAAKAVPLHATKTLGGRGSTDPTQIDLCTNRGEWSASRPGRAWAPGKGPPVPIVQEAGWSPESTLTQRLEEKSFRLCRGSNLDSPVVQAVARHYSDSYPAHFMLICGENLSQSPLVYSKILFAQHNSDRVSLPESLKQVFYLTIQFFALFRVSIGTHLWFFLFL